MEYPTLIFFGLMFFGFCALVLILIHLALRLSGGHRRAAQSAEARTIQEIYQGLQRMEKRVEALETILLDAEADKEANDNDRQ
jgi:phage shock protein B